MRTMQEAKDVTSDYVDRFTKSTKEITREELIKGLKREKEKKYFPQLFFTIDSNPVKKFDLTQAEADRVFFSVLLPGQAREAVARSLGLRGRGRPYLSTWRRRSGRSNGGRNSLSVLLYAAVYNFYNQCVFSLHHDHFVMVYLFQRITAHGVTLFQGCLPFSSSRCAAWRLFVFQICKA